MPADPVDVSEIAALFDSFRRAFPHLRMDLVRDHPQVDLWMDLPEQVGLAFPVNLNLQGDELHLSAGHFWLEWFPSTDPGVVRAYEDAVLGLLSGRHRIVERYRGKRCFRAELQREVEAGWETIGTWSTFVLPFPRRTSSRILRNEATQVVA